MITLTNISMQHGRQILFLEASMQLNPGEKVGLVGPNGAGKTTLFRVIAGEEEPDEGEVKVPKRTTIGYFRQDTAEMKGRSVLEEAIAGSGRLGDLHHELMALEAALADPAREGELDELLERYGEVQGEYHHRGGYDLEARAQEVLHGLGFEPDQVAGDVGDLSGGWKTRVAMAKVLLAKPDVLLLDEPTNHLDIESILWLEQFLKGSSATVLMTCHDRDFMNRTVTRIIEIDGGELTSWSGNYDFYARERAIRDTQREAAYARQQAMFAKERRFIERFAAHAAKAAQVQSRVKKLQKIEEVDPPRRRTVVKFDFRRPPRSGGERSRLVIARMLLDPPNFLVLDEPTNHLDLETKEMLVEALKDFGGTMLFVSHDRTFLRGLATRVLELEYGEDGERRPHLYPGSYVDYVAKTGREAPGVHA